MGSEMCIRDRCSRRWENPLFDSFSLAYPVRTRTRAATTGVDASRMSRTSKPFLRVDIPDRSIISARTELLTTANAGRRSKTSVRRFNICFNERFLSVGQTFPAVLLFHFTRPWNLHRSSFKLQGKHTHELAGLQQWKVSCHMRQMATHRSQCTVYSSQLSNRSSAFAVCVYCYQSNIRPDC